MEFTINNIQYKIDDVYRDINILNYVSKEYRFDYLFWFNNRLIKGYQLIKPNSSDKIMRIMSPSAYENEEEIDEYMDVELSKTFKLEKPTPKEGDIAEFLLNTLYEADKIIFDDCKEQLTEFGIPFNYEAGFKTLFISYNKFIGYKGEIVKDLEQYKQFLAMSPFTGFRYDVAVTDEITTIELLYEFIDIQHMSVDIEGHIEAFNKMQKNGIPSLFP